MLHATPNKCPRCASSLVTLRDRSSKWLVHWRCAVCEYVWTVAPEPRFPSGPLAANPDGSALTNRVKTR